MKAWKLFAALCCSAALFVGCSSNDDNGTTPVTPGPGPGPGPDIEVVPHVYDASIAGVVCDIDGKAIQGVTVKSGTAQVKTDENGAFRLTSVASVDGRSVVKFSKDGYFDVVRSLPFQKEDAWSVTLNPKSADNCTNACYEPTMSQTMQVGDMKVELQSDAYVNAATGEAIDGNVNTEMIYLDPNNEHFAELMPGGDLSAVREDGSDAQLISYGMTCVNMTDDYGNKLQLKEGKEAKLSFPIPAGMDGTHETIPLWSFDEEKGVWVEEGEATLVDGDHYEGTVKHFSWVNLDYPSKRATIHVTALEEETGRRLRDIKVVVGQVTVTTGKAGTAQTYVPLNEDILVYADMSMVGGLSQTGKQVVPAISSAGKQVDVTITIPKQKHITGTIVNTTPGGSNLATIYLKIEDNGIVFTTWPNGNAFDGTFDILANHTGPVTLVVKSIEGKVIEKDIVLDEKDYDVGVIDVQAYKVDSRATLKNTKTGKTYDFPISLPDDAEMTRIEDSYEYFTWEYGGPNGMFQFNWDGEMLDFRLTYHAEDGTIQAWVEGGRGMDEIEDWVPAKVTVKKQDDYYAIHIEGSCMGSVAKEGEYNNSGEFDYDYLDATFTIPVGIESEVLHNVNPTTVGLPACVPTMDNPITPVLLRLTYHGQCAGGAYVYNGTTDDYEALKKKAEDAGLQSRGTDENDKTWMEVQYYAPDEEISQIVVKYNGREWVTPVDASMSWATASNCAALKVTATTNGAYLGKMQRFLDAWNGEK